jgi:ABC-2 type transport system permease protein
VAIISSHVRLDVIEDAMFPATTALRYMVIFVPVVMYLFQAEFLGARDTYTSTLIGVSVAAGLQEALTGFTGRLQLAQERGTLESYLVEPAPWTLIPIAMNVWRSFTGAMMTAVMIATGWLIGGARIDAGGLAVGGLVFLLGIVACNAVGLLAASFLVLFKRGDPVIALYGLAAALVGGALFPIGVLPPWIRWTSYLVPHSYVIGAERSLLDASPAAPPGAPPGESILILLLFCAVVGTAGLWLFDRALRYARTLGILST